MAKETQDGVDADAALTAAKAAFIRDLEQLYRDFDSPRYPDLAQRSTNTGKQFSTSTVSDWLNGTHFPPADSTVSLVRAITGEGKDGPHVAAWRTRRQQIAKLETDRRRSRNPRQEQAEPEAPPRADAQGAVRRRSARRWWIAAALALALVAAIAVYVATRPDAPGALIGRPMPAGIGTVKAVTVSPNGHVLVAAGGDSDGQIMLWDISDPAHPMRLLGRSLSADARPVEAAVFSPNGRTLALGGGDTTARLLDVADPRHPGALGPPISVGVGAVLSLAFDASGRTLAIGGTHGVQVWQVSDPAHPVPRPQPLAEDTGAADAVAFSPNGRTLAVGTDQGAILLWDMTAATPAALTSPDLQASLSVIETVAFTTNGHTLAAGDRIGRVDLLDITDPNHAQRFGGDFDPFSVAQTLAFSPDNTTLAIGGDPGGQIQLWAMADLAGEPRILSGHTDVVESIAFIPRTQLLVSGSDDGYVRIWNTH